MLQELKIHRWKKLSYYFQASLVCDKIPFNGVTETEKRRPAVCFAVLVPASAQKHWRF